MEAGDLDSLAASGASGGGAGGGLSVVRCRDENGCWHKYVYHKVCAGAGFGASLGGGITLGMGGENCTPGNYEGVFFEVSGILGVGGNKPAACLIDWRAPSSVYFLSLRR